MKLKKLQIHNIASIEKAEIDFTAQPLANSELFLISGNTGSGKSTILDAICLALYATTPRMKNIKMNGKTQDGSKEIEITDTLQLIRRNTNDAFVRLTFTGNNTDEYQAEWTATRKAKNFDRIWKLTNLTNPQASPDEGNGAGKAKDKPTKDVIENQAVGLDFDQFCRTTILAQGDFTRFLDSDDKEKAEILEKVTGTEIYRKIGSKVFELTAKHKSLYENKQKEIDNIEVLSDEEINLKQSQLIELENELSSINQQFDIENAKQQWLKQYTDLVHQKSNAQKAFELAHQKLINDSFKINKELIKLWDATTEIRNGLKDIENCENEIVNQNKNLQLLHSTYISLFQGSLLLKKQIEKNNNEINVLKQEIEEQQRKHANKDIEAIRKEKDDKKDILNNLENAYRSLNRLQEANIKFHSVEIDIQNQQNQIKNLENELKDLSPLIAELENKKKISEAEYNKLKDTVDDFAKMLREQLHIGDTCPICGQTITNEIHQTTYWEEKVKEAKSKYDFDRSNYDKLKEKTTTKTAALNALKESTEKAIKRHKEDTSLDNSKKDFIENLQNCKINLTLPLQEENFSELANTISSQGKTARKNFDELKQTIDIIEQKLTLKQQQENKVELDNQTYKNLMATIDSIIQLMPDWKNNDIMPNIPTHDITNLLNDTINLLSKVNNATSSLQTAYENKNKSQSLVDNFFTLHPELNVNIIKSLSYKNPSDINNVRQQIKDIEAQEDKMKSQLDTILTQLKEHQNNKPTIDINETLETIQRKIENYKNLIGELNEKKGSLKKELSLDKEKKEKKQELIINIENEKATFQKWNRLNDLIGDKQGDKFARIAQSYILANLIEAANIYMKKLTNRYTLQSVPGQFIIMVEDAYQGYVTRPTSTVSGGESFLVSLALALALSDIGQNLRVETLFIDEGFGTLSGEPLQKAIETLQSLHKHTGRQVGIISHIEDIRERIPIQIQIIQNNSDSASTVHIIPE